MALPALGDAAVALSARRDPVLLLHGQPGGQGDWSRVVRGIGDRARTVAIDRPGWDGQREATDLPGNAAAALAALDASGIARAVVVGHSLGGAIAAWIAAKHPDRVSALVLAAPAANRDSLTSLDRWLAGPVAGYLAGAALLSAVGVTLSAAPVTRRLATELTLDRDYLRAAGRRLMTPGAWRAFAVEQRGLVRDLPSLEADLGRISAPTTILAGTADRIVPVSAARKLAEQIPGAELVVIERAGHLLPQRHGDRLVEAIVAAG
ncbi:MAG TPA: alpha/beta hydrolase [Solirubrobacteraceae bacterium]